MVGLIFDIGSVTGVCYLLSGGNPSHARLFRGAIGAAFLFMDGNARHIGSHAVQQLLKIEAITRLDWPAYSPI